MMPWPSSIWEITPKGKPPITPISPLQSYCQLGFYLLIYQLNLPCFQSIEYPLDISYRSQIHLKNLLPWHYLVAKLSPMEFFSQFCISHNLFITTAWVAGGLLASDWVAMVATLMLYRDGKAYI